jgi:Response regulator of the LytR/AlgR family
MPLKSIIVEDEPLSRIFLHNLLSEFFPDIQVIATLSNEDDAVAAIQALQPELVFLDIELQKGTGFEVLKRIGAPYPLIVFITAYDHYAIKPIQFSGIDYLLKPVDIDGLQQTINAASAKRNTAATATSVHHLLQTLQNNNVPRHLCLCTPEGTEFIQLTDIIRLESHPNETHFMVRGGVRKITSVSLQEYDTLLRDHSFLRIHQQHIVNVKEILQSNEEHVLMSDNSTVPVSPKKREEMMNLYQSLIH